MKGFDPWNIFIGTGVFIEDIRADFTTMIWKIIGNHDCSRCARHRHGRMDWIERQSADPRRGIENGVRRCRRSFRSAAQAQNGDEIGQMARTW